MFCTIHIAPPPQKKVLVTSLFRVYVFSVPLCAPIGQITRFRPGMVDGKHCWSE